MNPVERLNELIGQPVGPNRVLGGNHAVTIVAAEIIAEAIRGESPEIRLVTVPVHETCECQQGSSQGKKPSLEHPIEQSKSPEGPGIAFVGPYGPAGGISLSQGRGKGFLRRFLGY